MDAGTNFNGAGQFKFALVTSTNNNGQATAAATAPSGGFITVINVTSGGSGYTNTPAVTVSGGGGSGVTATATVTNGSVTAITVVTPGTGYTSAPTVTIAAPPPNISYTTYWSNDGSSVNGSEPATAVGVSVSNGLFTVLIGDPSQPNMLAISPAVFAAQPDLNLRIWFNDSSNGFAALSPVQNLTPAPYAIQALNANSASNLLGVVPTNALTGTYGNSVNLNNPGNSFAGNGAGLTNVNATALDGVSAVNFWQLGGNTVPATESIGTKNYQPFELWVNNGRSLRLEPGVSGYGAPNVIGGSPTNFVASGVTGATISGGGAINYGGLAFTNDVTADFGTVGGGYGNTASGHGATVGGGSSNQSTTNLATTSGGVLNTASGIESTVSGGGQNVAGAFGATVGGGISNLASNNTATVSGGSSNVADGNSSTVSGGNANTASNFMATVAGGANNTAGGQGGTVGGGYDNVASGPGATVAGGGYDGTTYTGNSATGNASVVSGGIANSASGNTSVVPGGYGNTATSVFSFAAGNYAHAVNAGAFVWSDGSAPTTSTANNQFMVRASGGVLIYTSNGSTAGVSLAAGSGTWSSLSDRNAKDHFTAVTSRQILAKVLELPITKWSYKTEQGVEHIGPMAQDFHAAFGVGEDDQHITSVDEDGVALAAIQGLNQKIEAKDQEIHDLERRLEKLELQARQNQDGK